MMCHRLASLGFRIARRPGDPGRVYRMILSRECRTRISRTRGPSTAAMAQRGIAAVEFALIVVLLLVIAFGLVSYGVLFWAKQDLSQLAGEGARYALTASMTEAGNADFAQVGCLHVKTLLSGDGLLQADGLSCPSTGTGAADGTNDGPCPWATEDAPQPQCATITLKYDVKKLPLAELVGELAGFFSASASDWVPPYLMASSTVQLVSDDG